MSEKQLIVNFESGEGRYTNEPVNYMICNLGIGNTADPYYKNMLYAERVLTGEGTDFEEGEWYEELRDEIIEQAKERGIDASQLDFVYDDVYLTNSEEHDVATHGFPGEDLVTDTRCVFADQNLKEVEEMFVGKKEEILKYAEGMFANTMNDGKRRLLCVNPNGELSVHTGNGFPERVVDGIDLGLCWFEKHMSYEIEKEDLNQRLDGSLGAQIKEILARKISAERLEESAEFTYPEGKTTLGEMRAAIEEQRQNKTFNANTKPSHRTR